MFAKCRPGRGRASRRAKLRQIRAFADRAKVIANAGISDVAISKGTMGALGCLVAAAIERAGAVEHTAKMEAERQTERFKSALRTPSPTISDGSGQSIWIRVGVYVQLAPGSLSCSERRSFTVGLPGERCRMHTLCFVAFI